MPKVADYKITLWQNFRETKLIYRNEEKEKYWLHMWLNMWIRNEKLKEEGKEKTEEKKFKNGTD